MWSAIFAFAEEHIKVTDVISSILVFSVGIVGLFTPFILGPLIENYAFILVEFQSAYLIASILLFVVIVTIIKSPISSRTLIINENSPLI